MSGKTAVAHEHIENGENGDKGDKGAIHIPEVADLLVAYLEQIGVEYVFGIPGGAIEPLYNALARSERRGGPRHILARHESGAAFMADGYARETGRLGVCCATSGPGATNLITGVSCARDNGTPLLVITAQPALPVLGKNALQESACTGINTLSMFQHCTRYNSLVSHPKQLEAKLIAALQCALRPPRGPAHLSFPTDVFRSPIPGAAPSYDLNSLLSPSSLIDDDSLGMLQDMLADAVKVIFVIGAGCGEAIGSILQFIGHTGATFITTPDGKGLINPRHPRFRGVFGFGGHESAEAALRDPTVDLVIAVGASLGELNSGGWNETLLNEHLVHVDESEENFATTPMAQLHVRGRIRTIFDRLNERSTGASAPVEDHEQDSAYLLVASWGPVSILQDCPQFDSNATPITPQRLMKELGRMFPSSTRFLADTGSSVTWATHCLHPTDRRLGERRLTTGEGRRTRSRIQSASGRRQISTGTRRQSNGGWLRVTMNFAPMGWAIGAAVGTAAANPKVPVVCITGDGSMLMNGQEISAAVAEKLTVIYVVLNDGGLGMVKHGQRMGKAEQIGCDIPPTDFAAMARAMGAQAYTVRSPEDMTSLPIEDICTHKGPTLLDVYVDPEEAPPMKLRVRVLNATQVNP
jgi:acetolactate synthase I/II/III large subunit